MKNKNLYKLLYSIYKNRKDNEFYNNSYNKAKSFGLNEIRRINYLVKMDLSLTIFISIMIGLLKDAINFLINEGLAFFNIENIELTPLSYIICAILIAILIPTVKKQTYIISILQDLQEDKKKELINNISTTQDELSISLVEVIDIDNINNDKSITDNPDTEEEIILKPMNNKIKHLEMIQSVINRLANNSFTLKSWTITLVVAVITFISKTEDKKYMLIAYFPIALFWILSSYYLYLEKLFRELYNKILIKDEKDIDFKMNIKDIEKKITIYCKSFFAISQILFYLSSLIIVTLFLKYVGAL